MFDVDEVRLDVGELLFRVAERRELDSRHFHQRQIQAAHLAVGLAGGGIKGGMTYGSTDEFGFAAVENKVHVHDLHATILHQLGINHEKLTYRYSGRDFRLTDVHGEVVKGILA